MTAEPDELYEHGPPWLSRWAKEPLGRQAAGAIFDTLPAVPAAEMHGLWQGRGLATGHPLDGVLENLDWFGKLFRDNGRADPLLFRRGGNRLVAIEPARLPLGMALRFHALGRMAWMSVLFRACQPPLRASGPAAAYEDRRYHGVISAAMIYDRQPIIDYFRRIDQRAILGVMEIRGVSSGYYFILKRTQTPAILTQHRG